MSARAAGRTGPWPLRRRRRAAASSGVRRRGVRDGGHRRCTARSGRSGDRDPGHRRADPPEDPRRPPRRVVGGQFLNPRAQSGDLRGAQMVDRSRSTPQGRNSRSSRRQPAWSATAVVANALPRIRPSQQPAAGTARARSVGVPRRHRSLSSCVLPAHRGSIADFRKMGTRGRLGTSALGDGVMSSSTRRAALRFGAGTLARRHWVTRLHSAGADPTGVDHVVTGTFIPPRAAVSRRLSIAWLPGQTVTSRVHRLCTSMQIRWTRPGGRAGRHSPVAVDGGGGYWHARASGEVPGAMVAGMNCCRCSANRAGHPARFNGLVDGRLRRLLLGARLGPARQRWRSAR